MAETIQTTTKELSVWDMNREATMRFVNQVASTERAKEFQAQLVLIAQKTPKIKESSTSSLIATMMACVQLDLLPNTAEQLAFVIPYYNSFTKKTDAQFQIGYKGLLRLAHRSGQIKSVNAELVFEGDEFEVQLGTNRQLIHKPSFDVDRTDYSLCTHAYVTVDLLNGATVFEVMTRHELDKIQSNVKATKTDSPWKVWPESMAKKTVLKRAAKLLPSSTKERDPLALAIQYDSWGEAAKLSHRDGQIVEADAPDPEEVAAAQKERMDKAVAARKAAQEAAFTPTVVEPIEAEQVADEPTSGTVDDIGVTPEEVEAARGQ